MTEPPLKVPVMLVPERITKLLPGLIPAELTLRLSDAPVMSMTPVETIWSKLTCC